jgi:hypothetical protein
MNSYIRSKVDGSVIYFKKTYMEIHQTYLRAMKDDNGKHFETEGKPPILVFYGFFAVKKEKPPTCFRV